MADERRIFAAQGIAGRSNRRAGLLALTAALAASEIGGVVIVQKA